MCQQRRLPVRGFSQYHGRQEVGIIFSAMLNAPVFPNRNPFLHSEPEETLTPDNEDDLDDPELPALAREQRSFFLSFFSGHCIDISFFLEAVHTAYILFRSIHVA